jgi:hypothetical protein
MPNGLSSNFTAIHSVIEPKYRSILDPYLTVQYVDKLVDGPSLGIEQVENVSACLLGIMSACNGVTGCLS